eukprot:1360117-Rhodomonas_salina.2
MQEEGTRLGGAVTGGGGGEVTGGGGGSRVKGDGKRRGSSNNQECGVRLDPKEERDVNLGQAATGCEKQKGEGGARGESDRGKKGKNGKKGKKGKRASKPLKVSRNRFRLEVERCKTATGECKAKDVVRGGAKGEGAPFLGASPSSGKARTRTR